MKVDPAPAAVPAPTTAAQLLSVQDDSPDTGEAFGRLLAPHREAAVRTEDHDVGAFGPDVHIRLAASSAGIPAGPEARRTAVAEGRGTADTTNEPQRDDDCSFEETLPPPTLQAQVMADATPPAACAQASRASHLQISSDPFMEGFGASSARRKVPMQPETIELRAGGIVAKHEAVFRRPSQPVAPSLLAVSEPVEGEGMGGAEAGRGTHVGIRPTAPDGRAVATPALGAPAPGMAASAGPRQAGANPSVPDSVMRSAVDIERPGPLPSREGTPASSGVGPQIGAALNTLLSTLDDAPDLPAPTQTAHTAYGDAIPALHAPVLRTLNLVLQPHELGRVAIDLRLAGATLTLTLRTEKETTRRLIAREVDGLKDGLVTAGYDICGIALQPADSTPADRGQRPDVASGTAGDTLGADTQSGRGADRQQAFRDRSPDARSSEAQGSASEPDRRTGLYV